MVYLRYNWRREFRRENRDYLADVRKPGEAKKACQRAIPTCNIAMSKSGLKIWDVFYELERRREGLLARSGTEMAALLLPVSSGVVLAVISHEVFQKV